MKGLNDYTVKKVDLSDVGCTIVRSDKKTITHLWIHEAIGKNFHGIITNVCKHINNLTWMPYLQSCGTYVSKGDSYHSKGLAIDLNCSWTYQANGTSYKPYGSMGVNTWNNYKKFICEVCDGKEDCPYNINYVVFKRYFEGNGWCWGGNWGIEHFDPMHFEIRENNKCVIARKQQITC